MVSAVSASIAVDVSLLQPDAGGLTRYLAALLPRVMACDEYQSQWLLYGRQSKHVSAWAGPHMRSRQDHLPAHMGRVACLMSTFPIWTTWDNPDVFWGPAHRLPLWLPSSTRAVVTVHDLCWLMAPQTMRRSTLVLDRLLMPLALQRAQAVIAVSSATRDALTDHFPAIEHKLHLVHEGVCKLPEPSTQVLYKLPVTAQWGVSAPYILFVGTLEPRKNLLRLLHAFARVVKRVESLPVGNRSGEALKLVLVGEQGWGRDKLCQTITELDLKSRVHVLGRVSDLQLATLYRHALFLAMPSLYEGFGLPLVEAMSLGTPVLTSATSSMPEVAGRAGLLVDPLDVDSIASGLFDMVDKPKLRAQLASHTRQQANLFSWERAAEQTLAVLLGRANGEFL